MRKTRFRRKVPTRTHSLPNKKFGKNGKPPSKKTKPVRNVSFAPKSSRSPRSPAMDRYGKRRGAKTRSQTRMAESHGLEQIRSNHVKKGTLTREAHYNMDALSNFPTPKFLKDKFGVENKTYTEIISPAHVKKQDRGRVSKWKQAFTGAKKVSKKVGHAIVETAKTAEKVSEFIEPWLDIAAISNPELAPLAALDTAIAETGKRIKATASHASKGKAMAGSKEFLGQGTAMREMQNAKGYEMPMNVLSMLPTATAVPIF